MTRRPYRLFKGNNFVERPYYSLLMCERFLMQPVSKRRSVHWVYSLSHSPNVELEYSLSHIHYCFSKVLFVLRPLMISKSTLCPTSINVFQKYSFSYTHRRFSNVLFVLHKPYFEIRWQKIRPYFKIRFVCKNEKRVTNYQRHQLDSATTAPLLDVFLTSVLLFWTRIASTNPTEPSTHYTTGRT